jgi:hypothetical protein
MKASEVFGIIVRTLGLWIVVQVVLHLAGAFTSPTAVVGIVMEAMLGFYLFFRADFIVNIAYRRLPPNDFDPLISR